MFLGITSFTVIASPILILIGTAVKVFTTILPMFISI